MSESQNTEVVKRVYAAFKADDVRGVSKLFASGVEWVVPNIAHVSLSGRRRGLHEVNRFFETLEEVLDFQQHEFIAHGDRVIVLGTWRGKVKSTGRTYETRYVHSFTVQGGQVEKYDAYYDTAAQAEAYRQ